ncbi:Six-hairpin glycosidase-like protein [Irpex lacteus]|nr:Six-hairpin glycosidase-like protein [Irpex lacteus]
MLITVPSLLQLAALCLSMVRPIHVKEVHGSVKNANGLLSMMATYMSGNESWITVDFGKEASGRRPGVHEHQPFLASAGLALSFTESPEFISPFASDDSTMSALNMTYDGILHLTSPLPRVLWTQPSPSLRGGYRYLTIIWYAGAYTVQTNTIALHTGRQVPAVSSPGWLNNATVGVAGPIIVDGAKRDRAVWPGDMGVAVPTQFVSTNDLLPAKNALATMFAGIDPEVWANYTKAVAFVTNKVGPTGLMNITAPTDWARLGGGGISAEGNAILYKVLINSADLATALNDSSLSSIWTANATALKSRFNEVFWLPERGMYRDNDTTTLCPQDANSIAVLYNLTTSAEQANSISEGLTENWNSIGAIAPELPDTIAPFIGSLELQAHFQSGNDARAMDLLHREWGYMLYTNLSVQSTLLEGYTANGSLGYRSYAGYNYDAAYTSHAHGWSSGPTSALTYYVLGLQVTSPQGRTWSLQPHTSGLSSAEGGFTTPLGWYGIQWMIDSKNTTLSITVDTPPGTSGTLMLPSVTKLTIDGHVQSRAGGSGVTLTGGKHIVFAHL